jgi:hypothetical protein
MDFKKLSVFLSRTQELFNSIVGENFLVEEETQVPSQRS